MSPEVNVLKLKPYLGVFSITHLLWSCVATRSLLKEAEGLLMPTTWLETQAVACPSMASWLAGGLLERVSVAWKSQWFCSKVFYWPTEIELGSTKWAIVEKFCHRSQQMLQIRTLLSFLSLLLCIYRPTIAYKVPRLPESRYFLCNILVPVHTCVLITFTSC